MHAILELKPRPPIGHVGGHHGYQLLARLAHTIKTLLGVGMPFARRDQV